MELELTRLPSLKGIYDGAVPSWARYLHPAAAESLLEIEKETGGLTYTSVWRSANASLWAIQNKNGAMPPGFSGHNYGLAVDVTLDEIVGAGKMFPEYSDLTGFMEKRKWFCHRRDGRTRFEAWHFNYLDATGHYEDLLELANPKDAQTWHLPVEALMEELYSDAWDLDVKGVQTALKALKFYHQKIDGIWGPYSQAALSAFQRAYELPRKKLPRPRDKRTLAFVTASRKLVKL